MSIAASAACARPSAAAPRARPSVFGTIGAIMGLVRSRNRLSELDDRMLRDIGVTRREARAEADRAAWDVPAGWRR